MTEHKSDTPKEVHVSLSDPAPSNPTPATHPGPSAPASGLGIASLVTGVIAFVLGWAPVFGLILGIAAIITGILALRRPGLKGLPIAGIITGGLAILWNLIVTAFFVISIIGISLAAPAANQAIADGTKAIRDYQAENKALLDGKKDFKKGETAQFGLLEVTVSEATRDYSDESTYLKPAEGKEYIRIKLTVKNTSETTKYASSYSFQINDGGKLVYAKFFDITDKYDGNSIEPGETASGYLVYEVTKGSTDLKLSYKTTAFTTESNTKEVVFTLEI